MADDDARRAGISTKVDAARDPCPEAKANFMSRLFFLWIFPIVIKGWKTPLTDADLWELRDFERGRYTTENLIAARKDLLRKGTTKYVIPKALFRNYRRVFVVTFVLKGLTVSLNLVQPILLNRLIRYLEAVREPNSTVPISTGLGWAFSLLATPLVFTVIENQYFLATMRSSMSVRSGLQGIIYDKSLRMSPSARAGSSLGEIVNLMQMDAQRVGDFARLIHILWSAPVQLIVSVALLFNFIGWAAAIGLVATVLTFPLQGKLMAIQVRLRKRSVGITDTRVKLMNEILQGIKAVKFYAWEQPFSAQVHKERSAEVKTFEKTILAKSLFMAIMLSIPLIIAVVTFSCYRGVFGQELTPAKVFTGITLLNTLRQPVMMIPFAVTQLIDARLGVKRIERFLRLEDTDDYARREDAGEESVDITTTDSSSEDTPDEANREVDTSAKKGKAKTGSSRNGHISIENAAFKWGEPGPPLTEPPKPKKKHLGIFKKSEAIEGHGNVDETGKSEHEPEGKTKRANVLEDISLSMSSGELTAVIGRVGAGKSSLVHAILGEMQKVRGTVSLKGSVAYVAQTAWIFNDTLRNNILFGKEYDERLYRRAIRVSALGPDIAVLPAGDQTAIGEKGINLSGGQKQRVSIARAVYADADVYIFDDPLSALDAHVSQTVFDKCISNKGALRNRLRMLITNQVQVLPDCNNIVFLENGRVRNFGSYATLASKDIAFQQLINESKNKDKVEEEVKEESVTASAHLSMSMDKGQSVSISVNPHESQAGKSSLEMEDLNSGDGKAGTNLIQDEERNTGNIIARAYYQYAVACGGVFVFTMVLIFWGVVVALNIIVSWWLSYWTEQEKLGSPRSLTFYIGIYFALGVGYLLLTTVRSTAYLTLALRAATKLHDKMLHSILHAPMSFFDTTPIGRILSRFSRDLEAVDQLLPQAFSQMLTTVMNLIGSYVFIAVIMPPFIGVAAPITIGYWLLQRFFNRTSLEVKRLDSISKSPIYAHFSETLSGLSTLRAYNKQNDARADNMEKIDINTRAFFLYTASNRWFSLYLELMGGFLIFSAALFSVVAPGNSDPSVLALALTFSLQVTAILGFSVRSITELEAQMNSVERLNYYGQKLEQEAATVVEYDSLPENQKPSKDWPATGAVSIRDVELRYRPGLDLVLKGVSVDIKGGEKVGVIGRTGSGKSTLMVALLRLVELASGSISVDGVNLADLGLEQIRSSITIIPQDSVLFSGTVRFNLDPFGVYSEPELWDALDKSHLKEFVQDFEGGLDAVVSEYGENLSAGQRQLICLTRALLRKSKVLILDEASSSLDMETDRLIQETIRLHLKDATILTIAHRLFTLADYDKIIVMDDGLVAEYGSPTELLSNQDSKFTGFVESLGENGARQFRELVQATNN